MFAKKIYTLWTFQWLSMKKIPISSPLEKTNGDSNQPGIHRITGLPSLARATDHVVLWHFLRWRLKVHPFPCRCWGVCLVSDLKDVDCSSHFYTYVFFRPFIKEVVLCMYGTCFAFHLPFCFDPSWPRTFFLHASRTATNYMGHEKSLEKPSGFSQFVSHEVQKHEVQKFSCQGKSMKSSMCFWYEPSGIWIFGCCWCIPQGFIPKIPSSNSFKRYPWNTHQQLHSGNLT